MFKTLPLYISPKGGSIVCFSKANMRIFQVCSSSVCRYSRDLHSAKKQLDKFESERLLKPTESLETPPQRKTTLKWNTDGELSEVDKARILNSLASSELIQCDLTCDVA